MPEASQKPQQDLQQNPPAGNGRAPAWRTKVADFVTPGHRPGDCVFR